jgi:serine/threonine-protein kinase
MITTGTSETLPGSSPTLDAGAFAPGTLLGDRYRIVALVGRGGMGEVYRAEDLRLGQTVALKFLPLSLEDDPEARERLLAEVRHARIVSHPNVCRVYDIAEVRGRFFLTMEYIDGEDLRSLLRRIGRLPLDKALEIARELSAGLAAAHAQGLLHRDLKPGNVMIDGRGHARITDFGLAVDVAAAASPSDFAGTIAYMAPERFLAKPATVQSDLYSLGLIMYEACTGKLPFSASSVADWQNAHMASMPTIPSALVPGIEPSLERAILRCLEKDPARRHWSAAQLAAALPGGDPLAAALAAGETPSPALVAASGEEGTLTRAQAWVRLAACAVGFATVMWSVTVAFPAWSPAESITLPHPELQRARARQILQTLGYGGPPLDSSWWVRRNVEYLRALPDSGSRGRARDSGATSPAALLFCYRESPVPLFNARGRISADDPAPIATGDSYLELDSDGRLAHLVIVPPREERPEPDSRPMDWSTVFTAAGVSRTSFKRVRPRFGPVYAFDARAAWEGMDGNEPARAEAAARNGKVTYFRIAPTRVWRFEEENRRPERGWPLFLYFMATLVLGGLGFLAFLAHRNHRLGRGDRRGAFRLAAFIFLMLLSGSVLGRHLVLAPGTPERMGGLIFIQVMIAFGFPLFMAVETWLAYMGFEPYVRRRWPHLLIASTRLLDGRLRDPLVGRSMLMGVLSAFVAVVLLLGSLMVIREAGGGELLPESETGTLEGVRAFIAYVAVAMSVHVQFAMIYIAVLLVSRFVLRKEAAAWMALLLVFFLMYAGWFRVFFGGTLAMTIAGALSLAGVSVFVFWKGGLLALAVWLVVVMVLRDTPWTSSLNQWYAAPTWIATVLIAGLAWWGFRNVLGRQSPFPAGSLER